VKKPGIKEVRIKKKDAHLQRGVSWAEGKKEKVRGGGKRHGQIQKALGNQESSQNQNGKREDKKPKKKRNN